jgi:hypothetical protein
MLIFMLLLMWQWNATVLHRRFMAKMKAKCTICSYADRSFAGISCRGSLAGTMPLPAQLQVAATAWFRDYACDKPWWCCSRCEQRLPRWSGRNENRGSPAARCRRLTLRSATGLSQRDPCQRKITLDYQGFRGGGQPGVSDSVSKAAVVLTIRHNSAELHDYPPTTR